FRDGFARDCLLQRRVFCELRSSRQRMTHRTWRICFSGKGDLAAARLFGRPLSPAEPRDAMGRAARDGNFVAVSNRWSASDAPAERPRPAPGQALSRSLVALDQNSTIIAVIELSQSSWLVAGMLPVIE